MTIRETTLAAAFALTAIGPAHAEGLKPLQGQVIDLGDVSAVAYYTAAISPETLNGVYGGSKAFVLALSQSLNHELAGQGVRVQAVLPGATATELWDITGLPVRNLPIVSAEDTVDAAVAGLDQGEIVTIPSLPDKAEWDGFDAARRAMSARLSRAVPARRYNSRHPQSAGA